MSGVTVHSGGVDAALRQRAARRRDRQIGCGHVRVGDVALANSDARHDPLVGGLHQFFEILIGQ